MIAFIQEHQLDNPAKLQIQTVRQNPMQLPEQHDWKGEKGCRTEEIKTNAEKTPTPLQGNGLKHLNGLAENFNPSYPMRACSERGIEKKN